MMDGCMMDGYAIFGYESTLASVGQNRDKHRLRFIFVYFFIDMFGQLRWGVGQVGRQMLGSLNKMCAGIAMLR